MKLILDFDDVLFKNTPEFKERMFSAITEAGIPRPEAESKYKEVREMEFSLKNFLNILLGEKRSCESLYEQIMSLCSDLINEEIASKAIEAGRENCYLVSNGDKEFQEDKINRSGCASLFREIYIVKDSKKETIEKICMENQNEDEIIFMDDKERFFADLDLQKYKNLKTVLYKRS